MHILISDHRDGELITQVIKRSASRGAGLNNSWRGQGLA